mgnify:CR=1 FL=1
MLSVDYAKMPAGIDIDSSYICFVKTNKSDTTELKLQKKIKKEEERIKYEKSKLPESGYMTVEEYEEKSRAKTRKEITEEILDKPDFPKDKNYIYVPQHIFKLVKYNEPVGSPELSIPRRLFYDRQVNMQGIVSGDYRKLVYPAVYYYAELDSVNCDLFLINLDETPDALERVKKANILNKEPTPIISTQSITNRKGIFKTLTPIDYSIDSSKLLIKEKIGSRYDGIWKTDLWIYDFEQRQAKKLTLLRNAISYYWNKTEKLELNNKRWDIYPIGFDANNSERVIVCAYAYTGGIPKFLGTWSIDINNEKVKLESATGAGIPVSVVGFKISKEHDVRPISELEAEAKRESIELKKQAKEEAKQKKIEEKEKKQEFKKQLHNIENDSDKKERKHLLKFKNSEKDEIEESNDIKDIEEIQEKKELKEGPEIIEGPEVKDTIEIIPDIKENTEVIEIPDEKENTEIKTAPQIKENTEVIEIPEIKESNNDDIKKEETDISTKKPEKQKESITDQIKEKAKHLKPIRETKQEPVKTELPDLNVILEKFKRDAGITPEQEAEDELYDLDELDNLE